MSLCKYHHELKNESTENPETLSIGMLNGEVVVIIRTLLDDNKSMSYQIQFLDKNAEIIRVERFARLSLCMKEIRKYYDINPRSSKAFKKFKFNGE